jgi:hypothetical protein
MLTRLEREAQRRRNRDRRRVLEEMGGPSGSGLDEADADEIALRTDRIRRWKRDHPRPVPIRIHRDPQLQRLVKGRDRED